MKESNNELQSILENRPSILRYYLIIKALKIFSQLIGLLIFLLGIALIVVHVIGKEGILNQFKSLFGAHQASINDFNKMFFFLGFALTLIGVLLLTIGWLCKLILSRNLFIFNTLPYLESSLNENNRQTN